MTACLLLKDILIHVILNPVVEILDIAVNTGKTNLVAFDTP